MVWKKWTTLFLALCLTLGLTACRSEERGVEGLVVEVQTNEAGDITAFVVEDRQGKPIGVRLAEGTLLLPRGSGSWTGEELWAAFQADLRVDAWAYASCYPRREELETADGEDVWAYWATSVHINGELHRKALTLRDGTSVDMLEWDRRRSRIYRLANGTELLRVEKPTGPENVYVMGQEGFEALSGRAQEKVRAYYEEQGLLYDEQEELEKSYAAYRELGEEFESDWVGQDVTPSASSETIMYFLTNLTLPQEYGGRTAYERQLGAAFNRETGEKLSNWDLFAVPEAEVRRRLPELCGWVDNQDRREAMSGALDPEWLVFFPDSLCISFPPGTLPGEENGCIISVYYKDAPEGFFRPWAIPYGREE